MKKVEVYGADWCGDTKNSIEVLKRHNVEYRYIDIEKDAQAAEWVKQQNDGKEKKPTVTVGDSVLSVPDEKELEGALRVEGIIE